MVYCNGRYYPYQRYCRSSRWNGWGRWVLLGVIIAFAILVFILFACFTARRRRRIGRKPFMGTGWAAGPNNNQAPQQQPMQYNSGGQYSSPGYQNKPSDMEQGGAAQSYYQPQYSQPPGYGQQTAAPGTYQPPTQPPPAANPGGWR
ncbi:hypothetical protein M409DRAFT_16515 [Zasmidium cellare ATCC 36951]|uniref:Chitin synthesis regulation, Congo red resistance, RCR protein n=1 Tax=Zasmidium cellare ATCC 36951 TaxID=1080233 RepID=A0A6A6D4A5_ZASCE|nr:uncharacterized protein M409DRAFT_16515 [Zasmidium cellare ATCC 36951]KAF2174251.1 hypothetical protein M409DRAFT_16515 [Zasmidium cellare ATCC 36951]